MLMLTLKMVMDYLVVDQCTLVWHVFGREDGHVLRRAVLSEGDGEGGVKVPWEM